MRYLFDDYVIDTDLRELRRGDATVSLEPLAFDVLAYLIQNRERVVSKDELREKVWEGRLVSESTLSSWMTTIRGAVGDNGEDQRLIRTVPRRGFRFVGLVSEASKPVDGTGEDKPGEMVLATPSGQHGEVVLDNSRELAPPSDSHHFAGRPRGIAGLAVGAGFGIVATVAVILVWQALNPFRGAPSPQPLAKFDAAATPLVDNEARRSLANYHRLPDFKALALATNGAFGVADGAPDIEWAKSDALRRCSGGGKTFCRIYAVGMDVVWSRGAFPLPAPRDLRTEPLDVPLVPDELPTLNDAVRKAIAELYVSQPDHRALAMTTGAVWIQNKRSSAEEAIRIALERCAVVHMRPCLMLSVNGFLTIQIPRSRRVIGVFFAVDGDRDSRFTAGEDRAGLSRS